MDAVEENKWYHYRLGTLHALYHKDYSREFYQKYAAYRAGFNDEVWIEFYLES